MNKSFWTSRRQVTFISTYYQPVLLPALYLSHLGLSPLKSSSGLSQLWLQALSPHPPPFPFRSSSLPGLTLPSPARSPGISAPTVPAPRFLHPSPCISPFQSPPQPSTPIRICAAERCWRNSPSRADSCHDESMVSGFSGGHSSAQQSLHRPQSALSLSPFS